MKTSETAILFFSRSVEAEAQAKLWIKSRKSAVINRSISRTLIKHTKSVLDNSGLTVFHFDEHQQIGDTFGERFAHAFQAIFDLGYSNVIALGNDTPNLEHLSWQALQNELQKNKAILGPNERGGAYLIGLNKTLFDFKTFCSLPWQCEQLLEKLQAYFGADIHVLIAQIDLNTKQDLLAVLSRLKSDFGLLHTLRLALGLMLVRCQNSQDLLLWLYFPQSDLHRGPPLVIC